MMKSVTLTAFMVCAAWLSFGQTARFGDLNRNSVVVTSAPPQSVVSVNGLTGAVEITAAQIGAVPYTGATQTVNLGGNDLIVSNDVHVGDDVIVGGHIEVDGRIELLGGGRYITGASYISGLVPLDPDTWHVSDRAVSGAFLYSGLRSAVDEAIWTAEYQLSWWASTNGLASTQQVADALAPMATTQHVAEAIAAIPVPDLSSRVAVQSGHATNLAVSGWLALPQSQPTNLIMRLVASNDVIMAIGVIQ